MQRSKSDILKKVKFVHLIGIGGIGMSGIAEYLLRKGYSVSGSDITSSFITERLKKLGAKIFSSHKKENISKEVDLVLYTSAVKNDNPEYSEAINSGIKLIRRAEMLGDIVNDKILISVGGTHGKTSTTAMIAKILIDNGFDPTVFVGGNLDFLDGGSSRIGQSKYAVVEADEYDRSFLALKSDKVIITSIETDHTDIYKDLDDIKNTFNQFCISAKKNPELIVCGDDLNVIDVIKMSGFKNVKYYGFKTDNSFTISNYSSTMNSVEFQIDNIKLKLNLLGRHNALNASAAFILGLSLGISSEDCIKSLKSFSGVQRRMQLKYSNGINVFDDYAHHPTEVKSSFESLKNSSSGRIITVFQPHLYSRTKHFYTEFADALKDNDIVILAKLYPAREKEITGVGSELIFNEIKKISSVEAYSIDDFGDIISKLKGLMKPGDTIVFQGAGNVTNLCDEFIKNIKIDR
ncbi:MAG TPA: UDP-N-acetylmuramate--L-alanine ligase [Ignavibacteria bacterium]